MSVFYRDLECFDHLRDDERLGFGLYSDDAPGLHGPTTGFQSVADQPSGHATAPEGGHLLRSSSAAVAPSSDRAAAAGFRDDS